MNPVSGCFKRLSGFNTKPANKQADWFGMMEKDK